VARGTVYHINLTEKLIGAALAHKGFSFVEVITQCPTGYGKRNKMSDPYGMLMWQKENSVTVKQAAKLGQDELRGKFIIGELCVRSDRTEFIENHELLIKRAKLTRKDGET